METVLDITIADSIAAQCVIVKNISTPLFSGSFESLIIQRKEITLGGLEVLSRFRSGYFTTPPSRGAFTVVLPTSRGCSIPHTKIRCLAPEYLRNCVIAVMATICEKAAKAKPGYGNACSW
ncbi:hypothetical protein CEXT_413011 [Caerostris extrusa]|uniref:Uncharacterized protein n=1 Tax=Caerostris extrusa TaxID=172846 RepID=A0AAV4N6G6_CAEEX|nr:hypothetical protein CEXT_413011 [Caerostris extrusa]